MAFIFRTTNLPSLDSFSICRENLETNRETVRLWSKSLVSGKTVTVCKSELDQQVAKKPENQGDDLHSHL